MKEIKIEYAVGPLESDSDGCYYVVDGKHRVSMSDIRRWSRRSGNPNVCVSGKLMLENIKKDEDISLRYLKNKREGFKFYERFLNGNKRRR